MLKPTRGGFRGGRVRKPPPPPSLLRDSTQRVPPLVLFKKCISGRPTLKLFYRRLWRQYILTNFEEGAQKKRNFLVKIFQKVPKNAFLGLFFQNFACGAQNLAKTGTKPGLERAGKIIPVDLKKI